MKILFVGLPWSVHAARWVSQLAPLGWDLHFFATGPENPHVLFQGVTFHRFFPDQEVVADSLRARDIDWRGRGRRWVRAAMEHTLWSAPARLARVIEAERPEVVHSLGIQHGGHVVRAAKMRLRRFPRWLVSNWGSDIQHSAQVPEERERILAALTHCNGYLSECQRDMELARALGYTGPVWPVLPNGGGFDLATLAPWRAVPPSQRKVVLVKGYQHWSGRAGVALEALRQVAPLLAGYRVVVYAVAGDRAALERGAADLRDSGVVCEFSPWLSHEDVLRLHGTARVSIALSTTDGISTSFLDALVMGSFPIQSDSACAGEWAVDGESVALVPAESAAHVGAALRRALADDALVDRAAVTNWHTAQARLRRDAIAQRVVAEYLRCLGHTPNEGPGIHS